MATSVDHYYAKQERRKSSLPAAVLSRAPLVMMTVIFTLISSRYLLDPVGAGAAVGISFTSPGGITVARVGFAAFPLSLAILAFASLISDRWRVAGLYMTTTVAAVVIAVRVFSIVMVQSMESVRLLAPEGLLLALSVAAIRLESARRRRDSAPA